MRSLRLLVEGGRFAKKGLPDAVKQSGRSLRQSWGLEQWFVSTAGRTLPVSNVEETDRDESSFWLLWAHKPKAEVQ